MRPCGLFRPTLSKNKFFWRKGSVNFYIFQLFIIVPKIRKNCYAIPEENAQLADGWTDRRRNSQTTMILLDRGPIIKVT